MAESTTWGVSAISLRLALPASHQRLPVSKGKFLQADSSYPAICGWFRSCEALAPSILLHETRRFSPWKKLSATLRRRDLQSEIRMISLDSYDFWINYRFHRVTNCSIQHFHAVVAGVRTDIDQWRIFNPLIFWLSKVNIKPPHISFCREPSSIRTMLASMWYSPPKTPSLNTF